MIKKGKIPSFLVSLFIIFVLVQVSYSADDFLPAGIKDISDRKYEDAVIQLLDNAKYSIVISMYSISLETDTKNPVKLLLNDLLEARDRGVSVTLYLNTRFRDMDKNKKLFAENSIFNKLQDKGCIFHLMPSNRRLHDKLIIVDGRYVVEGSTNWSIAALKNNFESSALIDSPDYASVKLTRLENILICSKPKDKNPDTAAYIENLPKSLIIPKDLISKKEYFPDMVTRKDDRSLDLYLLLLAHSQAAEKQEFFVSLEAMALSLGMPRSWKDTTLRRQVIRSLKKLQNRYHLINVKFYYGRDAAVILKPIVNADSGGRSDRGRNVRGSAASSASGQSQSTITIPTSFIIQPQNSQLTMRLKFLLMIEALLKDEGKDLYSMSQPALAKRFNLHRATIHAAFRDLRGYKT